MLATFRCQKCKTVFKRARYFVDSCEKPSCDSKYFKWLNYDKMAKRLGWTGVRRS